MTVNGAAELANGAAIEIGEVVLRFATELKGHAKPPSTVVGPVTVRGPDRPNGGTGPHTKTKFQEQPAVRTADASSDQTAKHLRVDELTALCKFMTQAVGVPDGHDLIALALRTILHQTTATLAGYLSLDPDDPTPKVVLPETAAVDVPPEPPADAQGPAERADRLAVRRPRRRRHPPTDACRPSPTPSACR